MTIRNENRAALVLSTPSSTAVEIVAPDLEMPGSIAKACEIPIIKALFRVTSFVVFSARSASIKSKPVTISMAPTSKILLENKASSSLLKNTPTNPAGTIEMIIFTTN